MLLEKKLEPVFHGDSYGYRPGRSAHDALAVCRRRCWKQDWILDLDVRAFFDSVPHSLLLKAVAHHTSERWVLLYISRWLVAPMQMPDGTVVAREKGTPQGSPISPILANLFMHYALDVWMDRELPGCPFERYADDVAAHCDTAEQARVLQAAIASRIRARWCPACRRREPGLRLSRGTWEGWRRHRVGPGRAGARGSVPSGRNREGLSTVAALAFGPAHSSEEAPVIGVERRVRAVRG